MARERGKKYILRERETMHMNRGGARGGWEAEG